MNRLLLRIQYSGIGVKIGDIESCSGLTCADDLTVHANTQEEAQVLTDVAGDFSGKQFYEMSHLMRKPVLAICEQQRRRSAWASAQSDQHLCCSLLG